MKKGLGTVPKENALHPHLNISFISIHNVMRTVIESSATHKVSSPDLLLMYMNTPTNKHNVLLLLRGSGAHAMRSVENSLSDHCAAYSTTMAVPMARSMQLLGFWTCPLSKGPGFVMYFQLLQFVLLSWW
jgi:hypothetical protein